MRFSDTLLRNPNDRSALKVLADQLLQEDDARGEYLALSLELEAMGAGDDRRWRLEDRLERLALMHLPLWREGLAVPGKTHLALRRGIPAELLALGGHDQTDWRALMRDAPVSAVRTESAGFDRLRLEAGVLDEVEAIDFDFVGWHTLEPGVRAPRLRSLTVQHTHQPQSFRYPFDGQLTSLVLREGTLPLSVLAALTAESRLSKLSRFEAPLVGADVVSPLERWPLEALGIALTKPTSLAALSASRFRESLSELSVRGHISAEPGLRVALGGAWPSLKRLRLGLQTIPLADVIPSLAALETVEALDLDMSLLGDDGAAALAARPMRALRSLKLGACRLSCVGVERLLNAPWAAKLEELSFDRNVLAPEAGALLAKAPPLERLKRLSLQYTKLLPAGVDALVAGRYPALEVLQLDLHDGSANRLLELYPRLSAWRLVKLTGVRAEGLPLVALAEAPQSSALRNLELIATQLTPEQSAAFVGSPHLGGLTCLSVQSAAPALKARFGRRLLSIERRFQL